jgi:hypothetical protein
MDEGMKQGAKVATAMIETKVPIAHQYSSSAEAI